ncbi:MAG: adenosyl-hopene transferase HpnH [Candidatus Dormibacteraeota bacterium]|nr:adenosyl-hopene transferase HpnH [Candidatus Dormibacteraeota bacterium]
MAVPMRQGVKVAAHVFNELYLKRNDKFALVLQLEPLYQCNLACLGCGKIQHADDILARRLSVQQCVDAVEECGAPIVSIAGGEPLVHREIHEIAAALVERRKFVYLCTNALLMQRKMDLFKPSPYFAWSVHIDGLRERHDESVDRKGTFDKAVEAVKEAQRRGFKVTTNSTFFGPDTPESITALLDYLNDDLKVDRMEIAPGFAYEKAPDQENFLGVKKTREIFREVFANGGRKRWRLNHSPLYLDFLEGKADFQCTAWAIPSYSVLGWQRPCYLMSDEPYAGSYRELTEETDWSRYGRGRHPKCENCMAHCGYEPTAVIATLTSLKQSIRALAAG